MTVLGVCPWCLTNVSSYGTGAMTGVQETIVVGEPRWWHQGCVADLNRSDREVPATGYTHGGGIPL